MMGNDENQIAWKRTCFRRIIITEYSPQSSGLTLRPPGREDSGVPSPLTETGACAPSTQAHWATHSLGSSPASEQALDVWCFYWKDGKELKKNV